MEYSGQPMKIIKTNRALLKKSRSFTELRKSYVKFSGDTFVATKNISDFERKKIRDQIIAQAKKDRLHEIGLYLRGCFEFYDWNLYRPFLMQHEIKIDDNSRAT